VTRHCPYPKISQKNDSNAFCSIYLAETIMTGMVTNGI
jgi:hypothetical protein